MDNDLVKAVERLEDFIEKRHARLWDSVEVLHGRVGNLEVTSAAQASDLKHHIYRTDLAEAAIKTVDAKIEKTKEELKPLHEHVTVYKSVTKSGLAILGLIFTAIAAAAAWLAVK